MAAKVGFETQTANANLSITASVLLGIAATCGKPYFVAK